MSTSALDNLATIACLVSLQDSTTSISIPAAIRIDEDIETDTRIQPCEVVDLCHSATEEKSSEREGRNHIVETKGRQRAWKKAYNPQRKRKRQEKEKPDKSLDILIELSRLMANCEMKYIKRAFVRVTGKPKEEFLEKSSLLKMYQSWDEDKVSVRSRRLNRLPRSDILNRSSEEIAMKYISKQKERDLRRLSRANLQSHVDEHGKFPSVTTVGYQQYTYFNQMSQYHYQHQRPQHSGYSYHAATYSNSHQPQQNYQYVYYPSKENQHDYYRNR